MARNYLLGLDIGTTATKTILIDENGEILASSSKEYPLITPKPGWAEQNPKDWYDASIYTIKDVIDTAKVDSGDIKAIGLSGQMHGSVFLDKNNDVIRPALLWCDQRTEKQCQEIYDIFGYENFIKLSYNKVVAGFTAPKILWLRDTEPGNYKKTTQILLPKDYIRFMLSGTYATEVSDASGTILMDIAKRDWSDEILAGLQINKDLLPKIFESYEVSAYVNKKTADITGLKEGTPIVGGGGDNACGNVGSGIIQSGIISDSIGTSGVVFAYSDEPVYDSQGRLHSFCHAVPGKWHLMGVTLSAAGSQKWYFDTFGPSPQMRKRFPDEKGFKLLDRQAENAPVGAHGLIFLPYLTGERTPYADPYARGVFFGLSYVHNQDHFARSIMEGVAYSQLDCLALMQELGIESKKIILIGGGAKSKIWRQIISDILEIDIVTLVSEEGPAFGAALLAGVGAEVFASVDEAVAKTVREASHTKPIAKNSKLYQKVYAIYQSLYKNLKDDYKKLYDIPFDS